LHSIRSLHRGLKALEVLNVRKNMTVAAMARELSLPRTTTFRILENLCSLGYLNRDQDTNLYGLTIRVRNLSSGFDDTAWLSETVKPLAVELAKAVIWPISIMAPRHTDMTLLFTTDAKSPMAIDYYREGTTLPILMTASGHIYLSHVGTQERDLVLTALKQRGVDESSDEYDLAGNKTAIKGIIERVKSSGYALNLRSLKSKEPGKTSTIAVPIFRNGGFLAALAMRYIDSALSVSEIQERYLPTLQDYANKMEQDLSL